MASAGLAPDADEPLTADHLEGVDIVFVMERSHQRKLRAQFGPYARNARIVCLDIPDDFDFMAPALVAMIETRVRPHLARRTSNARERSA